MNAYNLANRLTSLFEALARYLLCSSALAWLVLAVALATVGAGLQGDRTGLLTPVLVTSLLLPVPLFWWLSHRAARELGRLWERSDRNSTPVLLAMSETIDARAVMLGRGRAAQLRRRVLQALVELDPAAHTAESTHRLYDLALDTPGVDHSLLRQAAEALGRAQGGRASGSLRLWNLSAARGGSLDARLVGDAINRALEQPLPRRARPLLPVLASALRGSWGEAERLLLALLKAGRIAPRHLQADLCQTLANSAECPPALRRKLAPGRDKRLSRETRAAGQDRSGPSPLVTPPADRQSPPIPQTSAEPAVPPEKARVAEPSIERRVPRVEPAPVATRPGTARPRTVRAPLDRKTWLRRGACVLVILLAVIMARFLPGLRSGDLLPGTDADDSPTWLPGGQTPDGRAYTIQVMASQDSLVALGEGRRLRRDGYWSYVLGPRENSVWYRVRMGWFATRAEADSVAAALLANGAIRDRYTTNYEAEAMIWNPDSVGVVRR